MQNLTQTQNNNINSLPANQQSNQIQQPALPKDVSFTNYEIPKMANITPVEKPNFQQYFTQNIKPMFTDLMNSQLQQNQKLIGDYANQYQQTVKPLTDQLAGSIYGRNVGATSGLGQTAYSKGVAEIMRPVTEYGLQLQGKAISDYGTNIQNLAREGVGKEFLTQLSDYSTYQDRLFEQGKQTYEDTLVNKKYAADLANQFEMSKFGIGADISKMGYANTLQQGNMTYQSYLNEKQAEADNARQQGNMKLANQLQQETMALQQSYTTKNMEIQDKYATAMAKYQNALTQGNMALADQYQKESMKIQQDYNLQNMVINQLLGKDADEYRNALQQGNMKYAALLEQDANDRKQLMDMALSGKMGAAGADIVAKQLGLAPEIASAIKVANRDEVLSNYWNRQIANNLPIDERVMNSLAIVNSGSPLSEEEKKKYIGVETNLPPTDAFRRLIDNADKETLANAFGFEYDVKSRKKEGAWLPESEAYWDMDLPQNIDKFNDLYKNNKAFRDWVMTQI